MKTIGVDRVSAAALQRADVFLDDLENACGEFSAPCLRDDLADNRKWLRVKIAEMLDEVADGRPLYVRP